jgi:hypothetical protein
LFRSHAACSSIHFLGAGGSEDRSAFIAADESNGSLP